MQVFQIPPERIWVSVFEKDEEAFALWRDQVGVPEQRIKRMGAADNFWAAGPTGGLMLLQHVCTEVGSCLKRAEQLPCTTPFHRHCVPANMP